MTRATAPVAAEIIAGLPPTTEMTTAIVKAANRPTAGSTPAMIENEIASGISASPTTRPARTSVRKTFGDSQAGRKPRSRPAGDSTDGGKGDATCRCSGMSGGPGRAKDAEGRGAARGAPATADGDKGGGRTTTGRVSLASIRTV